MKAFFKDTEKIILNSMDYTEALVAQQLLDNIAEGDKDISIVERFDVNDDLDGLVISIKKSEDIETTSITVDTIELKVDDPTTEFTATYTPANSTDKLQAVSSNEAVFTLDESSAVKGEIKLNITPVSVGNAQLILAMGDIITSVDVTIKNAEGEDPEEIKIKEAIEQFKESTQLKSAVDINISKSTLPEEENIRINASKCSIEFTENSIKVIDEGLVPYIGGNKPDPKKWVGLLVDLNTKVQGDIYHVEDIDYSDASRWGASNDTTFIMWITPDLDTKVIRFTNVDNEEQFVDITIDFKEGE